MLHILEDSVIDCLKLIPFLFLAYLAMEYLEHRTGEGLQELIKKTGQSRKYLAPVVGGLLGIVPQCGFSAAAANLYTGRVITLGTLAAIFLSTSDEMLPILISAQAPLETILKILLAKAIIGIIAGVVIDYILGKRGKEEHKHIHEICEQENCHCEKGIFRSALSHTIQIAFFILVVTFGLELILSFVGEDALANLILNKPVLGPALAGIVGLLPNCAG